MTVLLVLLGGAVGAVLRYLTDRSLQSRHDSGFPWGTFTVNTMGSLILGTVLGSAASPELTALLGTGFCGALTTYSTFGYETVLLAAGRRRLYAALNVVASLTAGLGAAGLGLVIGGSLGAA